MSRELTEVEKAWNVIVEHCEKRESCDLCILEDVCYTQNSKVCFDDVGKIQ